MHPKLELFEIVATPPGQILSGTLKIAVGLGGIYSSKPRVIGIVSQYDSNIGIILYLS